MDEDAKTVGRKRGGPKTRIKFAIQSVNAEISSMSSGFFGGGLASEGYAGGYRDALSDVTLLLNGVVPDRRQYWNLPTPKGVA